MQKSIKIFGRSPAISLHQNYLPPWTHLKMKVIHIPGTSARLQCSLQSPPIYFHLGVNLAWPIHRTIFSLGMTFSLWWTMYYGPSQNRGRTYRQIYNKLFTKILQVYCGPPQSAGKAYQPTNKNIFGQSGELAVWSKFSENFSPIENFANKEYCQLGICAKVQNHIGNGVRPVQNINIYWNLNNRWHSPRSHISCKTIFA